MTTYKIIRHIKDGENYTITTGLTLEQAQAHCRNSETSSSTCKLPINVARTKRVGQWFDGYSEEVSRR